MVFFNASTLMTACAFASLRSCPLAISTSRAACRNTPASQETLDECSCVRAANVAVML